MQNNAQSTKNASRRQSTPQQMRASGRIFLAVGLGLAILFTLLSITQHNWRFLLFAATPIAFEIITGIVYMAIGTRNHQRTIA